MIEGSSQPGIGSRKRGIRFSKPGRRDGWMDRQTDRWKQNIFPHFTRLCSLSIGAGALIPKERSKMMKRSRAKESLTM